MADDSTQATQTDQAGLTRTGDGTLADQSQATTTQQTTSTETTTSQPAEGKTLLTEGAKPAEPAKAEEDKKEEPAKQGAPEKYEDYRVPEGYTLDPEIKTEADALFKGLGLTQDQAQSLVDFYTKQTSEAFQAPFAAYQEMTDGWRREAEAHPDLRGKLGPGQEVNVTIAKALDSLGDSKLASDFRQVMDLTGAGNHPAFIRTIFALARQVSEGSHVAGNGPSKAGQSRPGDAPATPAAAIWPNLPSARG